MKVVLNRTCLHCGKEFTVTTSEKSASSSRAHHFCEECTQSLTPWQKKKLKKENLPEYNERYRQQKRGHWLRHYEQTMLNKARGRAKKYNLDFNLTLEDIVIPEICPILEVPLVIGTKGEYEYSPSLDRIDNTKGYIKNNVQVISKKANSMKNSASLEELKTFCKNILRYSLNNTENECVELKDKEPLG